MVTDAERLDGSGLCDAGARERQRPKVPNELTLAAMEESRAMMAARAARFVNSDGLFDDIEKNSSEKSA